MRHIHLMIPLLLTLLLITACAEETPPEPAIAETAEPTSLTESSADTDDSLANFARFVEETRIEYEIPGVAIAVVEGNEIVLAQGFGVCDISGDQPVTEETLFHIGSTHKSITAMFIATLVDEGLLEWDEPVVAFVPDFELSEVTDVVTMRHLLSMSSGIPDDLEGEFDVEDSYAEDLFDLVAEAELLDEPGGTFSYSNIASSVSGYLGVLAIDENSDDVYEGYAAQLQERIFDPIGMETATLSVEDARASGQMSASHIFEGDEVVIAESYDFTGDPLAPSGSIKANVIDMGRYLITQLNLGVAPDGTRVVSEANLTETWQPVIDAGDGIEYALGWEVDGEVLAHEGSYDSFTSVLVMLPDQQRGLVVLTNIDDPDDFLTVVVERFKGL